MLKSSQPLRSNKPLKAKTSLVAKKTLKKGGRIKTTNTAGKLTAKADAIFGHYIRLRDSELVDGKWVGPCIDGCGKQLVSRYFDGEKWRWTNSSNIGHFHSRGYRDLRFDEINCNLQSSYCNAWEDKEKMQEGYRLGLVDKYGQECLQELREAAVAKGYLPVARLKEIIADYTLCLNDYLKDES